MRISRGFFHTIAVILPLVTCTLEFISGVFFHTITVILSSVTQTLDILKQVLYIFILSGHFLYDLTLDNLNHDFRTSL